MGPFLELAKNCSHHSLEKYAQQLMRLTGYMENFIVT